MYISRCNFENILQILRKYLLHLSLPCGEGKFICWARCANNFSILSTLLKYWCNTFWITKGDRGVSKMLWYAQKIMKAFHLHHKYVYCHPLCHLFIIYTGWSNNLKHRQIWLFTQKHKYDSIFNPPLSILLFSRCLIVDERNSINSK